MKAVNKLILLISVLLGTISYSQTSTLNILFDETAEQECLVDIEGEGPKSLPKFRKAEADTYFLFSICEQEFVFVKDQDYSFVTGEELKETDFDDPEEIDRETVMGKEVDIFLYEKLGPGKYCRYPVSYVHDFLYVE